MTNYEFKTTVTMKEYNCKKWWIDGNIIRTVIIQAENLKAALEKYRIHAEKEAYIEISSNALRTKNPMYIDTKEGITKQVGYVITGKTEFQRDDYSWSTQYVDLWVSIAEICDVDFDDIDY